MAWWMITTLVILVFVALITTYFLLKRFRFVPRRPWLVTIIVGLLIIFNLIILILLFMFLNSEILLNLTYVFIALTFPSYGVWFFFMTRPLANKNFQRAQALRQNSAKKDLSSHDRDKLSD